MDKPSRGSEGSAVSAGRGESLSIIVPFFDEEASVRWVLEEVRDVYPRAEIIAVDDGSDDGTWKAIGAADGVQGVRLTRHSGQSAAVYVGLQRASRPLCGLMDGDGQNDPEDFAKLVAALGEADVACGFRMQRRDTLSKRLASRIANGIRRTVLGDGIRDTGCSLKVFPRSAVAELEPFDGLHRFLPALFVGAGLRLVEVGVTHRPRRYGSSKYTNLSRAWRGIYDLIGVGWLLRRKIRLPPIEIEHERSTD